MNGSDESPAGRIDSRPRWAVAIKSVVLRRVTLIVAIPVLLVAGVLQRLFRGEDG